MSVGLGAPPFAPPLPQDATTTTHVETVTESVGVTDSTSRSHPATRLVSDSASATDTVLEVAVEGIVNEPVGVADGVTTSTSKFLTDVVGVNDETPWGGGRTIGDPLGVTDVVATAVGASRVVGDAVGVTDSASPGAKVINVTVMIDVSITMSAGAVTEAPPKIASASLNGPERHRRFVRQRLVRV